MFKSKFESLCNEYRDNKHYVNIATMEQFKEFLKDVNDADCWNVFEPEEYRSACDFAGLNYSDYDDPDLLFSDLRKFEKENEMEKGKSNL